MKRMVCCLLALALALGLASCTKGPEPAVSPTGEPAPSPTGTPAPTAPPSASPAPGAEAPSEEELLRAARRAVAREFDRGYRDYPTDWESLTWYYGGMPEAQVAESALLRRANAVGAVVYEPQRFYEEDGVWHYYVTLPADGEWELVDAELDLEGSGVSKTVEDRVVTATLENDRVFLTFADTEEAAYCLLGYGEEGFDYEEGRGYDLPGDALPLGPQHRYEVQGAFSRYRDLFLCSLGVDYLPYLFLVTEDDGLEFVDIGGCFRAGVFCAMPIPGRFAAGALPAQPQTGDDGVTALWVPDSCGESRDLAAWALEAQILAPVEGRWSTVLEDVLLPEGSYARMGYLELWDSGYMDTAITELDMEVFRGHAWAFTLGMTEEGVVRAYTGYAGENEAPYAGAVALRTGVELGAEDFFPSLYLTHLSGTSPYGHEGESLTFCGMWAD